MTLPPNKFWVFMRLSAILIVSGDDDEHFLSYGCCEENYKVLYSYHKRRIPNSFAGTLFNRNRLYYFLPSITDRSESIDQHMSSVNLTPIDITEKTFEVEDGVAFDPSMLDISCDKKN